MIGVQTFLLSVVLFITCAVLQTQTLALPVDVPRADGESAADNSKSNALTGETPSIYGQHPVVKRSERPCTRKCVNGRNYCEGTNIPAGRERCGNIQVHVCSAESGLVAVKKYRKGKDVCRPPPEGPELIVIGEKIFYDGDKTRELNCTRPKGGQEFNCGRLKCKKGRFVKLLTENESCL
eukprot:scpid95234/ scgid14713/ 